jgi:hypothetical protein
MTQNWKEDSMSHVDEGTLHAYLDGELPSSERAAVEAHLAECAACRVTLGEARALLERASALLGSARPIERPAPPFEHLRRVTKRSPWRVRTSVAWAASIMLAVGLGYYLRDIGHSASMLTSPPQALVVAEDRGDSAPASSARPFDHGEPGASRQSRRNQPRERRDEVARTTENASVDSLRRSDSALSGVVALQPKLQLRSAPPANSALAAALRDSVVLEEVVVTGAARGYAQAARGRTPTTTQWQIISRGTATSLLGTDPVGLPGLATRRIRRSPAPDATIVVEQALDSATVIQIFQRPTDAALYIDGAPVRQTERDRAAREAAPAAAPAPADRLARFVGRLRVEISGPLSPDSLNKLLEQVEPLP